MCGISGMIMRDGAPVPAARLAALGRALAHRGPDGHREHVDGAVGFRHERLAIIDLQASDQPLFDEPAAR